MSVSLSVKLINTELHTQPEWLFLQYRRLTALAYLHGTPVKKSFHSLVIYARVQKTVNSSYKPDPEILNLPTLSGTRKQNEGSKLSYFAKLKTE